MSVRRMAFFLAAFGVFFPVAAQACAVCNAPADDFVTHAYNTSVLFLMGMPFAVVGSIGGVIFFARRRASGPGRKEEGVHPPPAAAKEN
ncbi:MAG: hypothetical protein ACE5IM_04745 [Nitrospinota bacterium]